MMLRGGKQPEGPKEVVNNGSLHDKNEHVKNVEKEMSSLSMEVIDHVAHKPDDVPKYPKIISPKRCTLPLPFPQKMAKAKRDS